MCSVLIKTYAVFPYAEKYTFLLLNIGAALVLYSLYSR